MNRPQPKEIVVQCAYPGSNFLHVTASSTDAVAWVEAEAPLFGELYRPVPGVRQHYSLEVAATFDVEEVRVYLSSYGSGDDDVANQPAG